MLTGREGHTKGPGEAGLKSGVRIYAYSYSQQLIGALDGDPPGVSVLADRLTPQPVGGSHSLIETSAQVWRYGDQEASLRVGCTGRHSSSA
jgi:hypothetical protein